MHRNVKSRAIPWLGLICAFLLASFLLASAVLLANRAAAQDATLVPLPSLDETTPLQQVALYNTFLAYIRRPARKA